ncbi:hypothetical protein MMC18_006337 [Xylographa bjoerkii]|nr:hypothetical protein [Xylographa bjoerkii]
MLPKIMYFAQALVYLSILGNTNALWRLQCEGVVAIAPLDPIMSPGETGSHVHTVKGSSGFSSSATAADLLNGNCTSCQVQQDHSAYWTPALYFMDSNGITTAVPEVAGHLTYYKYTPCYINGVLTYPSAMPNGLTMISGDTYQRNFTYPIPDPPMPWSGADVTQAALRQKAIGFNCLNYAKTPEASLYRHFMPTKDYIDANCVDGLRLELLFPQCWNGSLDSTDHKSHLAFPDHSINGGTCPEGYDQLINQVFYETIFNTAAFAGQTGSFVLANGDPTGYGYHGDIIVAWEEGVLTAATDLCGPDTNPGDIGASGITSECPIFDITPNTEMASCKIDMPVNLTSLNVGGPMPSLPLNNPIQSGPAYATRPAAGAPTPTPLSQSPVPIPTLSYSSGSSGTGPEDGDIYADHSTTFSTMSSIATTSAIASSTSSIAPVVSPPVAATTVAPAAPDVNPEVANAAFYTVSTSMTTIGAIAYENILVEEVVTIFVTSEPTETAVAKRGHVHNRGRHQHHVRGV